MPRKQQPKAETGRPVGRPSSYKPEFAELARKACMAFGGTDEELARFFDVSVPTIDTWKKVHPEFLGAIKAGKDQADAEVAAKLFHRATGYSHDAVKIFNDGGLPLVVPYIEHYPPDTTAAIFWLKNRQRDQWRDRTTTELTGPNGAPIETVSTTMTAKEAAEAYAATLSNNG